MIKYFFYQLWQCTWGIFQTLIGLVLFFVHIKSDHFLYHGAIVTKWKSGTSISLGLFVFVSEVPFFAENYTNQYFVEELFNRLLVHEYGHTIQSLILGPLYLIVIGIPSTVWVMFFGKMRIEKQIPYGAFFCEKWANILGEKITKQKSIDKLVF